MPFDPTGAGPFSRAGIESLRRGVSGVYGLISISSRVVYIGQSQDVRRTLLEHLKGDNACINWNSPTEYLYEAVSDDGRVRREKELIDEYDPSCNRIIRGDPSGG